MRTFLKCKKYLFSRPILHTGTQYNFFYRSIFNPLPNNPVFLQVYENMTFENIVQNGNKDFLPFPNNIFCLFNYPFPKQALVFTCLKTLWEKEKLLMISNFSFSHSVFYPLDNFLLFSTNSKLSSANSFSLEESKTFCLGEGNFSESPLV